MSPIRKRRTDPIPTRTVRVRRNGVIFDVEEPTVESRFVAYFGEPTTDAPGLILNSAGDVYLVGPDGTRTQLEGGGGGGGSDIPIADQTDASSLDTTTYPNPIADDGSKLATLVFSPAETQFAMLATAIDDDAFPRVLLGNDLSTGWYFGDGTVDPWDVGASLFLSSVQDQSNALTLTPFFLAGGTGDGSGNALQIGALTEFGTVDEDSYYRTLALQSDFSLFSLGTVGIWVVDGESPQGVLPALNMGDLAIQYGENPGLWQATTNGDPTQAVWAAIGGSLSVSDGETTVSPASSIVFSGATVTDGGDGEADVSVAGGSQTILSATVNLASADILALADSPFTLVPAPGAGKAVMPVYLVGKLAFGSIGYTVGSDLILAASTSGVILTPIPGLASALAGTTDLVSFDAVTTTAGASDNLATSDVILTAMGDPTDGDGTLEVIVYYLLIDTA